ncbi:MAG: cellulase family glycosylhydrolase, partial [Planctomycetota bacterium]
MRAKLALLLWSAGLLAAASAEPRKSGQFVTARGDRLMLGEQDYRFMSFNVPNLHLVEDNFAFAEPNPWRWPNAFEIRDALESIRQMGGRATRIYVLSVRRDGSDMGEHVFVRSPGEFNEDAFAVLDLVLQIANETGIRLVIPLVDNWKWWGGKAEYARFRGKQPDDFWTDEQVIRDFEQTVRFTLNRVNTLTGVAYKNDPAILGWETGNELDSTPAWTRRISTLIKKLDPNHLVIDGNALHGVQQVSLDDPNIDVITTHHYPNTDSDYVAAISKAHARIGGKKPYFVGEFGFASPDELERVMDLIIDKGISGGMLWSLRFHNRDGGFYWHSEPSGENLYKSYHWPGFASGDAYDERRILNITQRKAYQIRGLDLPPPTLPAAPELLPIADASRISWRGAAGAMAYDVERANSPEGPWQTVGSDISDAAVQYRPLFSDSRAEVGQSYFYRAVAKNGAGDSKPSNVAGPVAVTTKWLVDECRDFSATADHSGEVSVLSRQARKTQEDVHRFHMPKNSALTYAVPEPIEAWRILLFNGAEAAVPEISLSTDGKSFHACPTESAPIPVGQGDYGYLRPVALAGRSNRSEARYLRVENRSENTELQLSRIEISYGGDDARPRGVSEFDGRDAGLYPSILLFHKPYHTEGVTYVQRAAKLGCTKVNVIVTLLCE